MSEWAVGCRKGSLAFMGGTTWLSRVQVEVVQTSPEGCHQGKKALSEGLVEGNGALNSHQSPLVDNNDKNNNGF